MAYLFFLFTSDKSMQCITPLEMHKYSAKVKKILADARKYSFYYDSIKLHAVLVLIGEHANTGIDVGRHSIVFNDRGWTFLLEQPTFVEIKYIFVYPEHRRTGFFTQILSLLQRQKKKIVVCTQERIMLQALIARGFQLDGHSLDGKELAYSLPVEPAEPAK